jgi:hypothetical protein
MAISTTTQFANRYGLNISIYAATDTSMSSALTTIDFANVSDIDISGDRTWATGGQAHVNKIGFNDPIQGTFKLSTQIMTMELLNMMAGGTVGSGTTSVVFENVANSMPKYYIIKAETVWQDEAGATYDETITFHKACPKRALNISYNGDGDPVSVDIEFDLLQDSNGKVLTITKADHT